MKKLIETLKRKWAEYLLEIIVIVVGILVAFALDSWNQKIATKRQLTDSMVKLLEDLKKDSLLLNVQFEVFHNFANNGELIKELLINQNNYEDINTIKEYDIGQRNLDFIPDTYKSMINTGLFYEIRNQKLQNRVTEYYRKLNDDVEILSRANNEISNFRAQEVLIPFFYLQMSSNVIHKNEIELYDWMNDKSSTTYRQTQIYLLRYVAWYRYIAKDIAIMQRFNEELTADIQSQVKKQNDL
jgi:hypothetical protein